MQVVITKSQLEAVRACGAYFKSPEWNGEALVYSDWSKTIERLSSDRAGITYLDFLVVHGLVPMTIDELQETKKTARIAEFQKSNPSAGSPTTPAKRVGFNARRTP